jgi:RNA polymerase sigma-70 factor (ECF subfamily)
VFCLKKQRICPIKWHNPPAIDPSRSESNLATPKELSDFLADVERRAFKQAVFAVRDDDAALDIVQDSMMRLAEKYGDRPAEELPLLFQRILQNATRDYFRRTKVRSFWTTLFSSMAPDSAESDNADFDPLETLEAREGSKQAESAYDEVARAQVMASIQEEIEKLPARQREAFLLRYWEELDVAETAQAMGCSEGSVKTHCSRATHALALALKAKGISL